MNGRLVPVSKAGPAYAVKHAAKISLAHPVRLAALSATGTGAFAAEKVSGDHKRTRQAEGAVGGGIAGWGAHQAVPYPVKWQARRAVQWNAKPSALNNRPELKRTVVAEQKMRGKWQRGHQAAGDWNNPASKMYRDFPAAHRRAKTMRAFGYTHGGRLGEAVAVASAGAGAALGVHAARDRKVSKAVLVPMIRMLGSELRQFGSEARAFAASSPVVVTPGMREGVRRTAENTPRSFVAAGAARKGGGLVLLAHADRKRRD